MATLFSSSSRQVLEELTSTTGTLSQRLYVQQDANFNVTALVEGTPNNPALGTVRERFTTDAYGGHITTYILSSNTWTANTDTFNWQHFHQGGRYDPLSNLYNFRNREYSPTLMRWMQEDPAGDVDGSNRYQLLRCNPFIGVDPMGLEMTFPGSAGQTHSGETWSQKSAADRAADYNQFMNAYKNLIQKEAKKHCIPWRLLALVLFGEVADLGSKDAFYDELGIGSTVGVGQLRVDPIMENRLIDFNVLRDYLHPHFPDLKLVDVPDYFDHGIAISRYDEEPRCWDDIMRHYLFTPEGNISSSAILMSQNLNLIARAINNGTINANFSKYMNAGSHTGSFESEISKMKCKKCDEIYDMIPSLKLAAVMAFLWDGGVDKIWYGGTVGGVNNGNSQIMLGLMARVYQTFRENGAF